MAPKLRSPFISELDLPRRTVPRVTRRQLLWWQVQSSIMTCTTARFRFVRIISHCLSSCPPDVLSPRTQCWSIFLKWTNAHFFLNGRQGRQLVDTDGLSRLALPHQDDPEPAEVVMLFNTILCCGRSRLCCERSHPFPCAELGVEGQPRDRVSTELAPFISRQHELSIQKGCLLWGDRVVGPEKLRCLKL